VTTWYSLEIGEGEAAKKIIKRVMDAFMPKYVGAGQPLGMAIFSNYSEASNIVTLYFSPKALSLAIQFGASPHEDAFVDLDLSLLVGDQVSVEFLFPE